MAGQFGLSAQKSESIVQGPEVTDHGGMLCPEELVVVHAVVVMVVGTAVDPTVLDAEDKVTVVPTWVVVAATELVGTIVVVVSAVVVVDIAVVVPVVGAAVVAGVVLADGERQSRQPVLTME